METITFTYNAQNAQTRNLLNYILASGLFVPDVKEKPGNAPCCYSSEELKQRVRQATTSVRAGRGYSAEEMKSFHPRLV
jgi:hypothetical protein